MRDLFRFILNSVEDLDVFFNLFNKADSSTCSVIDFTIIQNINIKHIAYFLHYFLTLCPDIKSRIEYSFFLLVIYMSGITKVQANIRLRYSYCIVVCSVFVNPISCKLDVLIEYIVSDEVDHFLSKRDYYGQILC
jgi:hypothetical protein